MRTRRLGCTGISIGEIGLGCMGLSWAYGQADEAEGIAVIRRAVELGVTLFDTADVYGPYTNELLVGRALSGQRDHVQIATKCGLVLEGRSRYDLRHNGHPQHVRDACDASLRRLDTEWIDLYQLHRFDPMVPLVETVGAMAELASAGKIRGIGLSGCTLEQLEQARAVHPIASVQLELSLATREPLADIVPYCITNDIAVLAYSPLGRGLLTGSIGSVDDLEPGDFRRLLPRFQAENLQQNLSISERIALVARRLGIAPSRVALAWLLEQAPCIIPIPGTKRIGYLEDNVAGSGTLLDPEALATLDSLPNLAGDRVGPREASRE